MHAITAPPEASNDPNAVILLKILWSCYLIFPALKQINPRHSKCALGFSVQKGTTLVAVNLFWTCKGLPDPAAF